MKFVPLCILVQTANSSVANTTTATDLFGTANGTAVLPASFLAIGRTIRGRLRGFFSTYSSAPSFQIDVCLGSTSIISTGSIALIASITNQFWELDFELVCRTTGATGTVIGQGAFRHMRGASDYALYCLPLIATGTTTIDTTAGQQVKAKATWSAANAANTITVTNAVLEYFDSP